MKKALKLLQKLILEFFALGRTYSWRYATYNLTWWAGFYLRTRFTWSVTQWALKKKTAWLDSYFKGKIIDAEDLTDVQTPLTVTEFKIWVFWGQGEADMPPLIKACYRQLVKYNDNVCLVTYDNARDYIDLPEIIYKKVRNGKLTWAHFSDIVRTSLLAKHGGLWLDATVWVSGKLPIDKILKMPFWSANSKSGHSSHDVCFWTSGEWNWSGWCLSSNRADYPLFSFVSKNLIERSITDCYLLDYVLIDYFINYSSRYSKRFRNDIKKMCITNPKRNELALIMGQEYEEKKYKEMLSTDFVFKLSYRTSWKTEKEGKPTFYKKLISGEL